jgi:phosphoribosylformimino-5-aminoimidazole carboxamide ribonucleotide (ProFAR) isomerase
MGLALTNKTIEKYFGFLIRLDNRSKKKLIIKLTESIEDKGKSKVDLKDLSGAWEDSRDSDEIIKEIRASRVNKQDDIEL